MRFPAVLAFAALSLRGEGFNVTRPNLTISILSQHYVHGKSATVARRMRLQGRFAVVQVRDARGPP